MITKKISTIMIAVLFSVVSVFAQDVENNPPKVSTNQLGLHAGFTTGLGLSFRHWSSKYGVQLTAIPLKTDNFQFISAGLTGMYSVRNEKYYRHFLYLGNHLLINQISNEYNWATGRYEDEVRTSYNAGFGYGFEVGKKVRFNLMVGYAGYDLLETDFSLLPTAEVGLYFML